MKKSLLKLTLAYAICVILIGLFWGAFATKHIVLWPKNDSFGKARIYSDIREGGFSTAEFFESDSALAVRMVLNSGVYHPHAGVEIPLESGLRELALEGMDFSNMDSVVLRFRASSDVVLVLDVADPQVSRAGDPLTLRPLKMDIPATRFYSEVRLPLSLLKPSKIWFDIHGIEPDSSLYMNRVVQAAVESGKGTLLGFPTEIEILQWEFTGKNRSVIRLSIGLLILFSCLYIAGVKNRWKKNPTLKKKKLR